MTKLEQLRVDLEYYIDTTHFGKIKGGSITTNKIESEPQLYITEDRDTQILDAWQVHHRNTTSVEDKP